MCNINIFVYTLSYNILYMYNTYLTCVCNILFIITLFMYLCTY